MKHTANYSDLSFPKLLEAYRLQVLWEANNGGSSENLKRIEKELLKRYSQACERGAS